MTTNINEDYRAQLLNAVEHIQARERQKAAAEAARQMSDQELMDGINTRMGLPAGTVLTDEQLERAIEYRLANP
jgi:hypothetical protein